MKQLGGCVCCGPAVISRVCGPCTIPAETLAAHLSYRDGAAPFPTVVYYCEEDVALQFVDKPLRKDGVIQGPVHWLFRYRVCTYNSGIGNEFCCRALAVVYCTTSQLRAWVRQESGSPPCVTQSGGFTCPHPTHSLSFEYSETATEGVISPGTAWTQKQHGITTCVPFLTASITWAPDVYFYET